MRCYTSYTNTVLRRQLQATCRHEQGIQRGLLVSFTCFRNCFFLHFFYIYYPCCCILVMLLFVSPPSSVNWQLTVRMRPEIVQCINHVNLWMSHYFLQFNKVKTEVLIIGAKVQRESKPLLIGILGP